MDTLDYNENEGFYSPFSGSVLIKAEEQGGKWIIYLQASNEGLDQESEVILSKALHDAKEYYLSHGVISWDHMHKSKSDPGYIIGEPLDVQFTKTNETLVKGWLYQKNPIAQKLWQNIESGAKKLGASVGGGILSKSKGLIDKVIWDETAVTHKPVNDGTLGHVQVIPFREFAKALMAGSGVDAAQYSGGRALSKENIANAMSDGTFGQSDVESAVSYEDSRKYFDKLMVEIKNNKIISMNDVINYTMQQGFTESVASVLIDFVARKIPALR